MLMMSADYYHHRADEEKRRQRKQKGPKLAEASGAPEPDPENFRRWDGSIASKLYIYRDHNGVPHTVVARWNIPGDKIVLPHYWAEGAGLSRRDPGWVQARPPHPILYRLPKVLQGVRDGKTVVIVEGEKDAEGAIERGYEQRGFVITTTLGGAMNNSRWNAWSDTEYSPLSGARVILVPDPGGAGSAWCEGVASCLMKLNGTFIPPTIHVGTIPPLSQGWHNGGEPPKSWGFGDLLPAAARDESDIIKILTDAVPFAQWKRRDPDPDPDPIEWPEPEPIEAPLLPVPVFDASALLPGGLRDFVVDEAWRMCCPVEYFSAAILSIASSLIGAKTRAARTRSTPEARAPR